MAAGADLRPLVNAITGLLQNLKGLSPEDFNANLEQIAMTLSSWSNVPNLNPAYPSNISVTPIPGLPGAKGIVFAGTPFNPISGTNFSTPLVPVAGQAEYTISPQSDITGAQTIITETYTVVEANPLLWINFNLLTSTYSGQATALTLPITFSINSSNLFTVNTYNTALAANNGSASVGVAMKYYCAAGVNLTLALTTTSTGYYDILGNNLIVVESA